MSALGQQRTFGVVQAISCAMVVRLPAKARSVRNDRLRFGGKDFGATAIRISAGSFRSLTSLRRSACCDAAGWSNPIERILSVRVVRRFGVFRFRPPRRSPGLEPRSMSHSPGPPAALRAWVTRLSRARRRADLQPARFHRRFHLADELLMICYRRH
jgi:hypothetical protein